jgi:parallel beta-helix repeat protein
MQATVIKASVQNWGQNDETNLVLQFLIDGTIVDSIQISFLSAGSSHTLSCPWSAETEGTHNVTAHAPPVVGEDNVLNNVKSTGVLVSYVIDVPLHFPTIQEAIGAASSGDTIHVASGTYHEDLTVDRSVTLAGENRNTTVIVAKAFRVVEILGAWRGSKISGFTIQGGAVGIYVGSDNNIIEDNTITNCEVGIQLWQYVSGNTIRRNTIVNNKVGILCDFGSGNTVYHNNFINNMNQTIDMGSNTWDFKGEGNHWSDYNGTDTNKDNRGDTPYNVNVTLGAWDYAPLMAPYVFLPSDLNDDGKVDISDLGLAAASFASYPAHPRWNPAADINSDGKVNMIDLVFIARNFGKTR